MRKIKTIFGLVLILVICPMNVMRGCSKSVFTAPIDMIFNGDYENDPRFVVINHGNGRKEIRFANSKADDSLLRENKYWNMGLCLLILSFMQFIAGVLLISHNREGIVSTAILLVIAILSFEVQFITGNIHSKLFILDWINVVSSVVVILLSLTMIHKRKKVVSE